MTEADRISVWKKRLNNMRQVRQEYEYHWCQIAALMMPESYQRKPLMRNRVKRPGANPMIYDPIGRIALRTLASGMHGGLTSPSRPWFELDMVDYNLRDNSEVEDWLYDCQSRLANVLQRSNFYDQIHRLYSELAGFGPGIMMIEEDAETTINCETLNCGEYWLASSNKNGRVDSLYRMLSLTAGQMMERWEDTVPSAIKEAYKNNSTVKYEVLHVIEPRRDYDPTSKDGVKRPVLSAYVLYGGANETILEESGYYEQPFVAARWDADYYDVYGEGPASDVLSDTKTVQLIRRDTYSAMQKELNPPLNVSAHMQGQPIKTGPGEVNYMGNFGSQAAIAPMYQVRANLAAAEHSIAVLEGQIKAGLYYDLFLLLSDTDKNMTATEVSERNAEKMMLLGPTLERLRSELFNPLISRVFSIMLRDGQIPEAPEAIAGQEIRVEFVGVLALAQRNSSLTGIERISRYVIGMAQAVPDILDKFDGDTAMDEMEKMLGISPNVVRSADQVEAIRAARAQQQAQMQQQQQAMQQGQALMQGMEGTASAMKDAASAGLPVDQMVANLGANAGVNAG